MHNVKFSFLAEGAHAYEVTVANNSDADHCAPTVRDKGSGAFVRLDLPPG